MVGMDSVGYSIIYYISCSGTRLNCTKTRSVSGGAHLVGVSLPAVEAPGALVAGVEGRSVVGAGEARRQVDILRWRAYT